jgi:beta-aspartyl-dipeptidase (metallo-type)
VREAGLALEDALPVVTSNTAAALGLGDKGRLEVGCDADLTVLERGTLAVRHVVAGGRLVVRDGAVVAAR